MAQAEKIQISSDAIKKTLRGFSPEDAVCQFIWNGFDAGASMVSLTYTIDTTVIDGLASFAIEDNGSGIDYAQLKQKFKPFYESEKAVGRSSNLTLRGKDGYGRLTFFKFASHAQWDTVYSDAGESMNYQIDIDGTAIDDYYPSTTAKTKKGTGTKVTFTGFPDLFHPSFIKNKLLSYILNEFAWYLEINKEKGFQILINGHPIDYSGIIEEIQPFKLDYQRDEAETVFFDCYFIQWKDKLNDEYSRFYFLNEENVLKNQRTTKLNKKGDKFYHSLIVKSAFFDNFITPKETEAEEAEDGYKLKLFHLRDDYAVFRDLIEDLNVYLKRKRKPFLKRYSSIVVAQFEKENVFPKFGNNSWDKLKKEELVTLVKELYEVEPALFVKLNTEQKKTFLHLLNLIIDNDERENLFKILDDVIKLDARDREELKELLTTTRLSSIIKATKLVHDRILALSQIKKVVMDHNLTANERDHLQKVIEQHYWLFGEQYSLVCAAEVKFERALQQYRYLLNGDTEKTKIADPDKQKEMDIFMVRQDYQTNRINNVVVELKSPTTVRRLGQKELVQIQTYMKTILSIDEFNGDNSFWEFYLIGQDYDDTIDGYLENAKQHGEFGLAFKVKNYKIYVKRWSEIFTEVELRLQWINQQLNVEKAKLTSGNDYLRVDELLEELSSNSAMQAPQVIIPNSDKKNKPRKKN